MLNFLFSEPLSSVISWHKRIIFTPKVFITNFAHEESKMTKFKILYLFMFCLPSMSFAHSFHIGLAKVDYDEEKQTLFSTLQLESNDLEHWLESLNLTFDLQEINTKQAESSHWNNFQLFIQKHFNALCNETEIRWKLFEVEQELDGRIFVYLYAEKVKPFHTITWNFSLLMGHSMEQQNKLEFKYISKDQTETFFAYFFENERAKVIKIKPN